MIVVLVVGLPGSGKTHYARERANQEGLVFVDDPTSPEFLEELNDQGMIITDPHLCRTSIRSKYMKMILEQDPDAEIQWVFFENDPQACLLNVERRQDLGDSRKVQGFIRAVSKGYEIPKGAHVLPVWRIRPQVTSELDRSREEG